MKIHIKRERRGEGHRVMVEYRVNGQRYAMLSPAGLSRNLIKASVPVAVSAAREQRKKGEGDRVAQVKTGEQK